MVKFESAEFLDELKEKMAYWQKTSNSDIDCLLCNYYPLLDKSFDASVFDDETVGYDMCAPLTCGNPSPAVTYRNLFHMIDLSKNAQLIDKVIILSDTYFICRVGTDLEQFKRLEPFFSSQKAFAVQDIYKGASIALSLVKGFTVFGYRIMETGDYNDDLPPLLEEDLFVEILSDTNLSPDDYEILLNAYLLEINLFCDIRLQKAPRPSIRYRRTSGLSDHFSWNPLLLNEDLAEVIRLFNTADASTDQDIKIIQYARLLELLALLYCQDKNALKAILKASTSRQIICKFSLPFLPFDKQPDLDEFDRLSKSIADTRDFIIHAKPVVKGDECPENQKGEFTRLLRALAMQAIQWYSAQLE